MRSLAILTVLTVGSAAVVLAGPSPDRTGRGQRLNSGGKVLLGPAQGKARFVPNRVLVAFRPGAAAAATIPSLGLRLNTKIQSPYFAAYDIVMPGISVEDAVTSLRANPAVRYAEPDFIAVIAQAPNDPLFGDLWGLDNTGQLGGTPDADIAILNAWKKTKGVGTVNVAVIDTGVDYTHQDLTQNIKRVNGHVVGYDYANSDNDPTDDNGHGTHCAGTIAARRANSLGVAGVAPAVKILPYKFLDSGGSGSYSAAILAIDAARTNGANVMSNSWSGSAFSRFLLEAVQRSSDAGILFVAAAGNNGVNVDDMTYFPAGFNTIVPNILSVAATDRNDGLASFSNYGDTVDIAAPGVDILSTTPGNTYGLNSGTSMACPHVAGVGALLYSYFPGITVPQIKARIINGAVRLPNLLHRSKTSGRLNAANALETDTVAPGAIINFKALRRSTSAISYQFKSPGDDNNTGRVASFDVRYSLSPIDSSNFESASPVPVQAQNVLPGAIVKFSVTGLVPIGTRNIYIAARAVDNVSNLGPITVGPTVQLKTPTWIDTAETTAKWTASGGFGLTTADKAAGAKSWSESPSGTYLASANAVLLQASPLVAPGPMVLNYQMRYEIETGYDNLKLEVSYDNGLTWSQLANYTGFSGGWHNYTTLVPSVSGNNVRLRWTFTSDSSVNYEGAFIDNIRFAPATVLFSDNVEGAAQFTPQVPWATTTLFSNSPTKSWTDSPVGNYAAYADTTLTSTGTFNGTNLLPALVQFAAKTDIEYGYDFLKLEISDNGGPFLNFGTLTGTYDWSRYTFDVSQTSRIVTPRFHFTADDIFQYDGAYIDDIIVFGEPSSVAP